MADEYDKTHIDEAVLDSSPCSLPLLPKRELVDLQVAETHWPSGDFQAYHENKRYVEIASTAVLQVQCNLKIVGTAFRVHHDRYAIIVTCKHVIFDEFGELRANLRLLDFEENHYLIWSHYSDPNCDVAVIFLESLSSAMLIYGVPLQHAKLNERCVLIGYPTKNGILNWTAELEQAMPGDLGVKRHSPGKITAVGKGSTGLDVFHSCNTLSGCSGSPIVGMNGNVVAMHRRGVRREFDEKFDNLALDTHRIQKSVNNAVQKMDSVFAIRHESKPRSPVNPSSSRAYVAEIELSPAHARRSPVANASPSCPRNK